MGNLLMESFQNANGSDYLVKWSVSNVPNPSTANARLGGKGVNITSGPRSYLGEVIAGNTGIVIGAAIRFITDNAGFLFLGDGSASPSDNTSGASSTGPYLVYSGNILYLYGPGGGLWGQTNAIPFYNTFNYIELHATPSHASGGTVDVQVNGVNVISVSGKNTITGSALSTSFNSFVFSGQNAGSNNFDLCDIYVNDFSGSYNNTFLGDQKVLISRATGNGATNNFTIGGSSPAGTNYQSINENTPDYDVTYVDDNNVGDIDLYAFGVPSGLISIKCLQVCAMMRKDDATLRQVQFVMRLGGTNYFSPTITLSTTYIYYRWNQNVNPATSLPWVVSDYTGVQFGLKIIT